MGMHFWAEMAEVKMNLMVMRMRKGLEITTRLGVSSAEIMTALQELP